MQHKECLSGVRVAAHERRFKGAGTSRLDDLVHLCEFRQRIGLNIYVRPIVHSFLANCVKNVCKNDHASSSISLLIRVFQREPLYGLRLNLVCTLCHSRLLKFHIYFAIIGRPTNNVTEHEISWE